MTQSKPQPPDKDFRAGTVSASIWRKEVEQNGRTVVQHSIRIQKRYRDKDGNWKDTDYFFANDLPRLVLVAQKAFELVALTESADEEDVPV
jgi:hypothetical protein